MTALTFLFAVLSPIIVALLRRPTWPKPVVSLLAVVVISLVYTAGSALDGTLSWPLDRSFWDGLFAAFGAQQFAYFFAWRNTEPVRELERF